MPTKRKNVMRKPVPDMPDGLRKYIESGEKPKRGEEGLAACYSFAHRDWVKVRDEIMAAWLEDFPGSRPWAWWNWDAPKKLTGAGPDAALKKRLKVSGSGTPAGSHLGFGMTDFYDVDPSSLPMVESEAAYLLRHELLESGEKERLQVGDFKPVPGYTWDEAQGAWVTPTA